ncbi:hypothetical protein PVAG01_05466 [Phlyctema vagabunda]|uniref:Uncharacterized protein n=1 Tax=Phlyctema vagabunda TaxID=108571 RepID=A0ABR4PK98_9HELO
MLRYAPRTVASTARAFTTSTRHGKIIPEATQTTPGKRPETVTDKAKDKAAEVAGNKATGKDKPLLNKDGAVGKEFKKDGAIGSIGEKVGGPFASDGAVGKNFNPDGAIGGTVHEELGKK